MEKKHRLILCDQEPSIRRDLEPNNILPDLGRVLNEKDKEIIKAQSTRQERCDTLLEILPRKGPTAFTAFVDALDKEAEHLALELIKAEKEFKEEELSDVRAQSAKLREELSKLNTKLVAGKQDVKTLKGVIAEQIAAGGFQEKETCGPFIPWQSESVPGDSKTRDLTKIILERDELKKQCESLSKHFEEGQQVVRNLEKRLTITFQDRATSPIGLEEFEGTEGRTEHDRCDTTEHSEKLRGEISQLKTELEAEKQDHIKTSQELEELKSHHEISKTEKSEQIKKLDDRIQQLTDERDSAARESQTWKKEIQKWKTKSEEYERENQVLQESLERAMEQLSSDLQTANKEPQEQIRLPEKVTEQLQYQVANEREQRRVERDSALKENQTLQKTIQQLKKKNTNCQRGYQALQKRYNNLKMSKKPEAVKETQQGTVKLGDKVTKQKTEFEEKFACKKRKEMKTAAAKKKELESATKAKTSLQAQVVKLENKLKDCQIQMSEKEERFRKETSTERFKSNRLEGEVNRLKSRLMEAIRPGRVHYYEKDFDTNGVVYALAKHFGGPNSIQTRIIATRSSNQVGEASDILENRVDREIVSGTMAEKESWWCVDLTENYALYLTHYTLRHGHNTSFSYLLNWQLQGSHDGQSWETLRTHDNDRGLKGKDSCCTCTWAIGRKKPGEIIGDRWKKAFRYFRIFQTGKHSSGRFGIFLSGIELYGVLVETGR